MWKQLCFLPQASDIVGAFQCMAGLWTRESQHCPALQYQIKRNLLARHWTWNKLLLPQASLSLSLLSLFFFFLISKIMRTSVWNSSSRLWVILCWIGISLLLLPSTTAAFTLRRLARGRTGGFPTIFLALKHNALKRWRRTKITMWAPVEVPFARCPHLPTPLLSSALALKLRVEWVYS